MEYLTRISTFLALKLKRICSFKCSTMGVKIFIQFSFRGVYRCGGTGIFLASFLPSYNAKYQNESQKSIQASALVVAVDRACTNNKNFLHADTIPSISRLLPAGN